MTKVKVCGITNMEDAVIASSLGANFLGFNFYPKSPRFLNKKKVKEIIETLPRNVKSVGIFVNENIKEVKDTINFCKIGLVQLSGDESESYVKKLRGAIKQKIIKCFHIRNPAMPDFSYYTADYIMLDSFKKGFYGGTGKSFNWKIAENINSKKLFLSGGLNVNNVKEAIQKLKPYAVDVCSSVELYQGKKDFEKMRAFIEAVK